jgi:hypothetical protein
MTAAWDDPTIVNAAFDIACDVRSFDPADVVNPATLSRIPADRIADLIVVLAYMVDVDAPFGVITGHLGEIDTGTNRMRPYCTVGHPAAEYGYWGRGSVKAQRCKQCDRELALRRVAAA